MERSWILVGMMGAGKSTVGRLLAEKSDRDFLDTDQLIVRRLGRPINQLFQLYGQEAFREHEAALIRSLEPGRNVIATGGGTVLREDNWEQFRRLGRTVYLDLAPELLVARLEKSNRRRPLLEVEDWPSRLRAILEERAPLYRKADISVSIDTEDHEGAANRILAILSGE